MSVRNADSLQLSSQEKIVLIDLVPFEKNADVIKTEKLKIFALKKINRIKADVVEIQEGLSKSDHLPDVWLESKITTIISKLPKNLPEKYGICGHADSVLFLDIFKRVEKIMQGVVKKVDKTGKDPIKTGEEQKERRLESAIFKRQTELNEDSIFLKNLKKVRRILDGTPSPKIFMAYAWPLDRYQERESEVQSFLRILESHLRKLGMSLKLDLKHCYKGEDIYKYINEGIKEANTVLVFGTESLLAKHRDCCGIPIICSELNLALRQLEERNSLRPKILPILLTGNMEASFPANFKGHLNTLLLPEIGYYEGIKALTFALYGLPGVTKDSFSSSWEKEFGTNEQLAVCKTSAYVEKVSSKVICDNDSLQTELSSVKEENILLKHELEEEKKAVQSLNSRIQDLTAEIETPDRKREKMQEQLVLLTKQVADLSNELLLIKETALTQAKKIEILKAGSNKVLPEIAFGKADWEKYFGEVGEEPPLPPNIEEILKSACPFWPDKRIEETHLLVLVPETVNGVSLTLNGLSVLIKFPEQGYATQYRHYHDLVREEYGDKVATSSYWVLLTKDLIPNSTHIDYSNQCGLIAGYRDYEVPQLLDVVVGILMHHVKTGERLYTNQPYAHTKCKEVLKNGWQTVVGGFSPGGLFIDIYYHVFSYVGVGGSRKF